MTQMKKKIRLKLVKAQFSKPKDNSEPRFLVKSFTRAAD